MLTSPSVLPGSGKPQSAHRGRRLGRALTCSAAAAVTLATGVSIAAPAQAATSVVVGSAGDAAAMSRGTGVSMPVHTYSSFGQNVPNAAMITVGANAPWRTVAAAGPGSALYNDIVRWANTIKSRPGTILLAYHHEPEAGASSNLGSASDYISAYRHVVNIFRAQGVKNVRYVWQMTAFSFRASPSDRRAAAKWYPGDPYVDVVGADGYNWGNCYGHGGQWVSMASFTNPVLAFARAHGKQASLPEFGAAPDGRRAQWLNDAHQYIAANRSTLTSVFYFNNGGTGGGCSWRLTTSAEFSAYGSTARDLR